MDQHFNKEEPEVTLRAFRAIDEPETCALFVEGHINVLTSIGVTKVTSSKNGWTTNPAVFVIIVESADRKKVFGGARVHIAGGTEQLPIEQATGSLDPSVYALVRNYARQGTGEICGLWNSSQLSGYGIGTPLLIRALIAISMQIGLKSLFALCAPYTVKPVINCGMVLVDSIGNKGTFYYPKIDLLATAMVLNDVEGLSKAIDEDRQAIIQMRENAGNLIIHELKRKRITLHFKLNIPGLDNWSLNDTIIAAEQNFLKSPVKKISTNFI